MQVDSSCFTANSNSIYYSLVICTVNLDSSKLLHSRLGHVLFPILQQISEISSHVKSSSFVPCDVCHFVKQSRSVFPISDSHAIVPFQLLHYDLWGPYKHKTYFTCKSFLTIVDDYTKCTWTFLLSNKSQFVYVSTTFLLHIQNQFQATFKTVRSNNGTKFFN